MFHAENRCIESIVDQSRNSNEAKHSFLQNNFSSHTSITRVCSSKIMGVFLCDTVYFFSKIIDMIYLSLLDTPTNNYTC